LNRPKTKEEHALREVYANDVEEAMAAWQDIRGEGAAWGEYRRFQSRSLKWFVESSLKDAADRKIGVGWYQRGDGRQGWRNGSYIRRLVTPYGTVYVEVPRLREGTYEHGLFDRKGLLTKEAQDLILETYLSGPSTRRVVEVLERVLGYRVSPATVSSICKGLDDLLRQFWRAELTDEWRYLLLDGVVMKNRAAVGAEKRVVLVAMGISMSGRRQILSFTQVESESEVCWNTFLEGLYARGFRGENLRLIVTDGNPGIEAAVATLWSNIPHQRCWVHKLRNVASKLRRINQRECLSGAKRIYLAENRKEAVQRFREWQSKWAEIEPRAVTCLAKDIEKMLHFFDLPEADRVTMRTTNPIERVFSGLPSKKWTPSIMEDEVFNNDKAVHAGVPGRGGPACP
jgi:putative transposase